MNKTIPAMTQHAINQSTQQDQATADNLIIDLNQARTNRLESRREDQFTYRGTADAQALQMTVEAEETSPANELPLTVTEEDRYAELNAVVHRHKEACHELCMALQIIHDQRLYRKKYKSFKEYCKKELGFSRAHGYRLLDAAQVIAEMSPIGDIPKIKNVHQALALKKAKQRELQPDTAPAERVVNAPPVFPVEYVIEVAEEPDSADDGEAEEPATAVTEPTRKIVPLPTEEPMQLKSHAELKKMTNDAHNMCSDQSRRQELANLLGKIEIELDRWIIYEEQRSQHQEAA